jgi:signal transduction histidine kinase
LKIIKKASILEILFQDNGIGFNQNAKINGQGILGIKERVALLGGTINIVSDIDAGTQLLIQISTQKS